MRVGQGWFVPLLSIPRRTVALACVLVAFSMPLWGASNPETKVRVGVLVDNYPFSFRTEGGQVDGFAYELLQEIERTMDLHFVRTEGRADEINGAFRAGQIDLLQSYADFSERSREANFSVPYVTMAGAIFVRTGERQIDSIEDLRGRRVAVHRGSLGETILRRAGLDASIVYAASIQDALLQVSRGAADATLVTRLSGLTIAHHFGLNNLRAVPGVVNGYEVRYCIAVQRDNHALLARVNEGLAILVRTGRFDEIYRKWFGRVEPDGYTARQVGQAVMAGLTLALIVSLWVVVRLRRLQARILRQQEELRASEEWHRAVFEGALDGLIVLERGAGSAGVRQLNTVGLKLLKLTAAPPPGTALATVLGADAALVERITSATEAKQIAEFEYERANGAGWWRIKVGPLGSYTLLALGDITEAVRTRQQLREQELRLVQTQKLEAIGTLAGGVAHDFNNILTAIIGNTELCMMDLPKERPEHKWLERAMQASTRARQLVRQILTFSRRQETERQPLTATPIIQETMDLLRSAGRGGVEFEIHPGKNLPAIMADPGQLHQVLMNIGMNAVQAMRGMSGRLTMSEEPVEFTAADAARRAPLRAGRYVRISLQDTGPGIPADVLPRIFEPFFSTKPPGEGTGLGLSVVHGIMEQHGGAVTVYSHPGRGTRFDLYFPVAEGATATVATKPTAFTRCGLGETILVVDDDPECLEPVREILLHLGYRVASFDRPLDAWDEFQARPDSFALVLTDLAMPGMNGLELAGRIRGLDARKPVVVASGFFTAAEEQEAQTLHVTRTLNKPLTVAVLHDALPGCLRNGS